VRFLVELSLDDRPVTSRIYNYESPEFRAAIKWIEDSRELKLSHPDSRVIDGISADEFYQMTGYKGATNRDLAVRALNSVNLSGAPGSATGTSVADWLRMPSQRERIPEIVKATWGERAVLNADIGLGPDNEPLAGSPAVKAGERPHKEWNPAAATDHETGTATEPNRLPMAIVAGSVLVLFAAGYFAFLRRPKSP
jgi:hypothetical protein